MEAEFEYKIDGMVEDKIKKRMENQQVELEKLIANAKQLSQRPAMYETNRVRSPIPKQQRQESIDRPTLSTYVKQSNVPTHEAMNEEDFNERNDHEVNSQSFNKARQKFII